MYFDAHTHVHFAAFADDYGEVIRRALSKGIGLITAGTQSDTSRRAIQIAHEFENEHVYATVGLHPIHTSASYHDAQEIGASDEKAGFTSRGEEFDIELYKRLADDKKVVGIGECGLDYYHLEQNAKKKQIGAFVGQIELAQAVGKPLVIHCREAFTDLISVITEHKNKLNSHSPGVLHFFTGSMDEARVFLDLGFSFTFGGVITFARQYDDVIKMIPPDRILSETDAPYVAPAPYRGKRNEPVYVVEVVKKLAALKGLSAEDMEKQICDNIKSVFGIS